jgi:PAS domain S-box-containing protein
MNPLSKEIKATAERRIHQDTPPILDYENIDREKLIHELQVHQIELEMQNEELNESQSQLQRLGNEYKELFYEAPIPYFVFDRHGTIITANGAANSLLNKSRSRLERKPFITFLPPDYHTVFFNHINRIFTSDGGDAIECALREAASSAGTGVPWIYMKSRRRDRGDGLSECLSAVFDITEQKWDKEEMLRARDIAVAANRAKDDFLASMSHELRTPLNAILGFGQVLLADTSLGESHAGLVREIVDAGSHLLGLVNDVLNLARVGRGETDLEIEVVPVAEAVSSALSLVRNRVKLGDIRIENRILPEFLVQADKTRLQQILVNLLTNAIKYNRPDGSIDLFAYQDTDGVNIVISDTGYGIAADRQSGIFQPFNRLGRERGDIPGSGIGLMLSKQLCEFMHGSLAFASAEGEGSSFIITLPAAKREPI